MKSQLLLLLLPSFCNVFVSKVVATKEQGSKVQSIATDNEETKDEITSNMISMPLLHHHHVRARNRKQRNLQQESNDNRPPPSGRLYQGYGTHYVDLWVGQPIPQRQTVIVDTGSSTTAFPCQDCTPMDECGDGYHTDVVYQNDVSVTFETVFCGNCTLGECHERGQKKKKKEEYSHDDDEGDDRRLMEERQLFLRGGRRKNGRMERRLKGGDGKCHLKMRYAEGSSWDAFEAMDMVYFGGPHDEALVRKRTLKHSSKNAYYDENDDTDADAYEENDDNKSKKDDNYYKSIADVYDAEMEKTNQEIEEKYSIPSKSTEDIDKSFGAEVADAESHFSGNTSNDKATSTTTATDTMSFSVKDFSFPMKFGCQTRLTGLFNSQLADGIMGMENAKSSFWMQMYDAGIIPEKKFSLCFSDAKRVDPDGTEAGTMTLGGADERLHKSKMVYAENVEEEGWFTIYINDIHVRMPQTEKESKSAKLELDVEKLNQRGIIIDSGTTESYMPQFVADPFRTAFEKVMGSPLQATYKKTSFGDRTIDDYLPSILFQLKGVPPGDDNSTKDDKGKLLPGLAGNLPNFEAGDDGSVHDVLLEVKPSSYMRYNMKHELYVSRFRMDEDSGYGVLGANAMFGKDILFDAENQRIGIAESDCQYKSVAR